MLYVDQQLGVKSNVKRSYDRYWVIGVVAFILISTLYVCLLSKSESIISNNILHEVVNNNEGGKCRIVDATRYFVDNAENTAKCIDGTLPVYYHRRGFGDGVDKWIIFFEGGGWCWDLEACELRSKTVLGSSKFYKPCLNYQLMNFYISNNVKKNSMMYNWNSVLVKYCDGSSYAGDSDVDYQGTTLHFRGMQNRNAVIRSLLRERSMSAASEVVVAGCSAGGLGVYMGLDHIAEIVHQHNGSVQVRGLADSGFFADYSSDSAWRVSHMPQGKDDAVTAGKMDYAGGMRRVYEFTGMSKGVHQSCVREQLANSAAGGLQASSVECAFAKNLAPHIRTPLFALQPRYDQWQILHVLSKNFTAGMVNTFGAALLSSLQTALLYPHNNPGHGAFVDSCAHHCTSCSDPEEDVWSGPRVVSNSVWGADKLAGDIKISVNGALAFQNWYQQSSIKSKKSAPKPTLLLQNKTFPCFDCCMCTVHI